MPLRIDKNAIIKRVGASARRAYDKYGLRCMRLITSAPKNITENIISPTKNASIKEYLMTFLISRSLPSASRSEIIFDIAAGNE